MKKWMPIILLVCLLVFALIGCNTEEPSDDNNVDPGETFVLRIAFATANDTQHNVGKLLKENIEANTDGRVTVELYPANQYGTNQMVVDSVQNGTLEAMLQPTAFLGGFAPVLTTGDLPYLWPDQDVMLEVLNETEIGQEFKTAVEDKGVKIIWFYNEGTKHITTNTAVNSVEDMKGKKFRVMGAPVLVKMMPYWGATAVPLDFGEIYTALQQRTVDGIEQTPELTFLFKYYEAAPYTLLTAHGLLPIGFMVNIDWFESLPDDIREAIEQAAIDSAPEAVQFNKDSTATALQAIEDDAKVIVTTPTDEVLAAFKEAVAPLYDAFVEEVPEAKKYVDGFLAEVLKRTE